MKPFEFAKYYDITDVAKEHNSLSYKDYEKIFICVDTWDYWIARIMKNTNDEYEHEEGVFLIERNKIEKSTKSSGIDSKKQLLKILDEDDLSNWDNLQCDSLGNAIEQLEDGFGIGTLEF